MVSGEVPAVFEGDAGRNAMPATFFQQPNAVGPVALCLRNVGTAGWGRRFERPLARGQGRHEDRRPS